jgi:hypothetical protein
LRQYQNEDVKRALYEQALDAGLTEKEAKAEIADRRKVKAAKQAILIKWAREYLRKKCYL